MSDETGLRVSGGAGGVAARLEDLDALTLALLRAAAEAGALAARAARALADPGLVAALPSDPAGVARVVVGAGRGAGALCRGAAVLAALSARGRRRRRGLPGPRGGARRARPRRAAAARLGRARAGHRARRPAAAGRAGRGLGAGGCSRRHRDGGAGGRGGGPAPGTGGRGTGGSGGTRSSGEAGLPRAVREAVVGAVVGPAGPRRRRGPHAAGGPRRPRRGLGRPAGRRARPGRRRAARDRRLRAAGRQADRAPTRAPVPRGPGGVRAATSTARGRRRRGSRTCCAAARRWPRGGRRGPGSTTPCRPVSPGPCPARCASTGCRAPTGRSSWVVHVPGHPGLGRRRHGSPMDMAANLVAGRGTAQRRGRRGRRPPSSGRGPGRASRSCWSGTARAGMTALDLAADPRAAPRGDGHPRGHRRLAAGRAGPRRPACRCSPWSTTTTSSRGSTAGPTRTAATGSWSARRGPGRPLAQRRRAGPQLERLRRDGRGRGRASDRPRSWPTATGWPRSWTARAPPAPARQVVLARSGAPTAAPPARTARRTARRRRAPRAALPAPLPPAGPAAPVTAASPPDLQSACAPCAPAASRPVRDPGLPPRTAPAAGRGPVVQALVQREPVPAAAVGARGARRGRPRHQPLPRHVRHRPGAPARRPARARPRAGRLRHRQRRACSGRSCRPPARAATRWSSPGGRSRPTRSSSGSAARPRRAGAARRATAGTTCRDGRRRHRPDAAAAGLQPQQPDRSGRARAGDAGPARRGAPGRGRGARRGVHRVRP